MITKEFIREIFTNVIEDMNATDATYATYFSPDYVQYVNDDILDYNDFVAHMRVQKAVMQSLSVEIKHIVIEDDKISTVHHVRGVKKAGEEIEAKVVAYFQMKNNKIALCNELTHLIKGDHADKDLGSRR